MTDECAVLRGVLRPAGDIQAPEAQTAGKGEGPEKTVSPADQQALLQFLRMMRKGKVGHTRGHVHPLLLMLRAVLAACTCRACTALICS